MKVSVAITTYNHEEFIAKAIDSILMQTTDFDYEIVIGEDCSTDNTRNILIDYKKRYPDKFKLLLNEKNIGALNFKQTLQSCNGEYVAILDGDDYWTSPHKLQKQVDFLDRNPECAICFHNVEMSYKDNNTQPHLYCTADQKEFSTVEDLLVKNFIPTCSAMFRSVLIEIPDWIFSLAMLDWPVCILMALQGKIGYINEVMGVYVIHSSGVWSMMRQDRKAWEKADIDFYESLHSHLESKYKKIISGQLNDKYLVLSEEYADMGDFVKARAYAVKAITKHFLMSRRLVRISLRLYVPILFKLLKSFKRATYSLMSSKQC